jgi:hypothetical protein
MKSNKDTAMEENAMINLGKYTFDTRLWFARIELLTA